MSKLERVKREIDFHEKMFFAAAAALLALVGWMGANYVSASLIVLILVLFVIIGVAAFGIDQYRRIKRLLNELEKL